MADVKGRTSASRKTPVTYTPADEKTVRPYSFRADEAELDDLHRRILDTRWPEKELVNDQSQGVQLETMQAVAQYWAHDYDWRKCEARLNALPNFITEIDGLDIHFLHIRSPHEDALPLIITHGWPGSFVEQLKIIGPLTNPTAHGASESEAFHVVIPSMPGYGFSGKPTVTGWDPPHIARAWVELMKRLGYNRFVAQGGDWGAFITELMGSAAPPELLGIHINMPSAVPLDVLTVAVRGGTPPTDLSSEERSAFDQLKFFFGEGLGYAIEMGHRPQTLYALADSPIGLTAWLMDHDWRSYELKARAFAGDGGGITRDDILDNATLFWLTNTAISAARLYWENKALFFAPLDVTIPVAVSAFPDELYQAPRSWVERADPKLLYYNKHDQGGHFAAWEQPERLVSDIRAGFKSLR